LKKSLRYNVIIIILYFVALYNISIVYISLLIIKSLKSPVYLMFLRYIITLELRSNKSIVSIFGLFFIFKVLETYYYSLSLFSSTIALLIACFRCLIITTSKSFVLILIYTPKTKSINTRPLGLTKSLIAFTAIYNKTSLFILKISISKILYTFRTNI